MKIYLRVIWIGLFLLVFDGILIGDEEECKNIGLIFVPVREEFVDELPEEVRYLPMQSMMPVVYRGGAQNWDAMKWTAESLSKMGFPIGRDGRNVYVTETYIKGGERGVTDKKLFDLLESSVKYREDYFYSPEFYNSSDNQAFTYFLFAGSEGSKQIVVDYHEGVLLAQLEGERLVLLVPPAMDSEKLVECIDEALEKYMSEGMSIREAVMKMIDDEGLIQTGGYGPLQRVILRPGDVLYIAAGWGHRVFYLKDSIGVAQQIMRDNVNWGN